jgi:glycosyltransferase involved in cell wall biosynthesis
MVGTIEPRKGHRLMLDLWQELLARGIPQRANMTLLFAGRRGWKTDALMQDIEAARGPHFIHLDEVWDARLERLYADCAFCVMPSAYEGFGLPIVEAFAHGKATLASTGGALPEVAGDLSPCLPLDDRGLWLDTLERWLMDASERQHYEARIRASFHRREWRDVAADVWRAAVS